MVEPGVSLLEWGFTDKQGGKAKRIHVIMDWSWCYQYELMFNLI